ncbi:ChaN family lipoprotein [Neolewinella antarctica]|uniref:Uncharacterized protein n=1 Tax=Neolewinella antarctica TaxID=442734 RepID=A0ABX0X9S5_9BACT|nr:ChaN family lipoprotein [Neolewinella antarctica]NJC25563.1 hypothetical protein [Neolewinella antarctica]
MKYLLLPLCLLLTFCADNPPEEERSFRQPSALDTIGTEALKMSGPVQPLLPLDSINAREGRGELRSSWANNERTRIGQFKTVWGTSDLELEWGLDSLDVKAVNDLENYKLVDATEAILERAADHQVIIFAENHNRPQHRVFTACLLEELYNRGYRHLGLEGVIAGWKNPTGGLMDTALQQRGYPITYRISNIFPLEPEFANLIREATDLGFQLFGYDSNDSSDSERDVQMAEHVINYQKAHPGEKIILHGGWYHAVETDQPKGPDSDARWMAYHYKTLTGDDPLTVYQDALNEKVAEQQTSSPYYDQLVKTRELADLPMVLVDDEGAFYRGPNDDMPFDIITVQAPLDTRDGYGAWQNWACGSCTYGSVNLKEIIAQRQVTYPMMVELRRYYEHEMATPVYAVELRDANFDFPAADVCTGRYQVTLRSSGAPGESFAVEI